MKTVQRLIVLSFVLLAACSKQPGTLERLGGEAVGIFSNRPLKQDQFVAVLKLKSPALLTAARQVDGQMHVDPEHLKRIDEEQTQAIQDLKALSSEVRVIFRYRMVLNGLAIVAPMSVADHLKGRLNVVSVEREGRFARPITFNTQTLSTATTSLLERNSVKFIGSEGAYEKGVRGQGIKVGIIDTGIDYTHSMLGGIGTEEAFKNIDPSKANPGFPNAKVVGGIDLAGTQYDTGSPDVSHHVPTPDDNPLDEAGHGTHVAGTVAGIGDGVETYSGVAPDADLYAIKVFGANGSTGDAVVIAGMEYAADPNRDGVLDDQLDVVNLSLGSNYGSSQLLYGEAVRNLSVGGTIVVASAGNSGAIDYIVGAPGTVDEAISVAASIDDGDHNWQFDSVKFQSAQGEHVVEAVEAPIAKPIKDAGPVSGKLVYAGLANEDFSPELTASLKGHVAFIDRGAVSFSEKFRRAAAAGAVGVVVANNQPGAPFPMGGEGQFQIPAVMISQELGATLKEEMKSGDVVIHFQNEDKISKPEMVDQLTDFSSKGPRSLDGYLKPEITAPGSNIISAAMGGGTKGVKMSGTSMSAPHMAGVMALLKQAYADLTSAELKSLVMGKSLSIADGQGVHYPLSRQGAGRVQVRNAMEAQVVADRVSLSFGEVNIETQKIFRETVRLKSISKNALTLKLVLDSQAGLTLENPQQITLAPGESKDLVVKLRLDLSKMKDPANPEMDGLLKFMQNEAEIHRIPVLAMVRKISQVKAQGLKVAASSKDSAAGALTQVSLTNTSRNAGAVLPFNLLGMDARKINVMNDPFMTRACDLQAVGYRLVNKMVDGLPIQTLQIGIKTYDLMTTWNLCDVSVLIDANGDELPEQELVAMQIGGLSGLGNPLNAEKYASILLDATKAREIRAAFEKGLQDESSPKSDENYAEAVVDLLPMSPKGRSTVQVLEVDVTKLSRRAQGTLAVKVVTSYNGASSVEMDDYLGNQARQWQSISLEDQSQSYRNLPEEITMAAGSTQTVEFDKGQGSGQLLLLYPDNRVINSDLEKDGQIQILRPVYSL